MTRKASFLIAALIRVVILNKIKKLITWIELFIVISC